jgi:hypothetical protein
MITEVCDVQLRTFSTSMQLPPTQLCLLPNS